MVLKKNGKLGIYVDFPKLNFAMKDLYPLPLIDEILNIVVGHEMYSILDRYYGYQ